MRKTLKQLAVLPALALVVGAVALVGGALAGSGEVPSAARSLTNPPKGADFVAPAPEHLSSVTVTRDWNEVVTSNPRPPR